MSKFKKNQIIYTLSKLGTRLLTPNGDLLAIINSEQHYNAWFTPPNVLQAIKAIGGMLNEADLATWLSHYPENNDHSKKIGLILAGNIPLVGFHDVLCVIVSGNIALIKASSQDARLIQHILKMLVEIEPAYANSFMFVDRLNTFDAVIATGSNNSSRYFEHYFGKVPHIIRKNRNSVAVLKGDETTEQLNRLGNDIFDYYGLGCRNVSKLFVPAGYNFNAFFEAIQSFNEVGNHHKYHNNYDYNKSIYLVNRDEHLDNGFLLLKRDAGMASPLAVLFYEEYADEAVAKQIIDNETGNIQCIVSKMPLLDNSRVVDFGQSQRPALWDYADGIDTMEFLSNLYNFGKLKAEG